MNDQIYNIINSSIVLIAAIIGFLASFFEKNGDKNKTERMMNGNKNNRGLISF